MNFKASENAKSIFKRCPTTHQKTSCILQEGIRHAGKRPALRGGLSTGAESLLRYSGTEDPFGTGVRRYPGGKPDASTGEPVTSAAHKDLSVVTGKSQTCGRNMLKSNNASKKDLA
ncbi:MAG: hypothetical protein LBS79_02585 [Tannerella sp.]|nr:hypothetical protein [Tannerella sp.]